MAFYLCFAKSFPRRLAYGIIRVSTIQTVKEKDMAYKYPYDVEKETPRAKLSTNRKMWKFLLFSYLTFGIYGIIFFIPFSLELDRIHPSGTKQMNYVYAYILAFFTFSIVLDIWHYQNANRVSEALAYRGIDYEFGTRDFWLWFILGSFIFIGPFVYFHKLCTAMNLLCEDYNENPVITD